MPCSPSWFGWNGAAGAVGMSPSTHLVPGSWQTSCPMLAVPFHPNQLGEQGMARQVLAALGG